MFYLCEIILFQLFPPLFLVGGKGVQKYKKIFKKRVPLSSILELVFCCSRGGASYSRMAVLRYAFCGVDWQRLRTVAESPHLSDRR